MLSPNLSSIERFKYTADIKHMRRDPIWFMKEILGWKTMFPKQEEIIRTFYQSKYNNSLEYKKLVLKLGQRSGKTVIGAYIAAYEFIDLISYPNPQEHYGILPHNPIVISCVGAGKEQLKDGVFSLLDGILHSSEWIIKGYDITFTDMKIKDNNSNCFIQVAAAKAGTGAGTGYTAKLAVGDEIDLWQQTDSKVGAEIVWSKMVNSTQTLGIKGKCVALSSTQFQGGMISKLYEDGQYEKTTLSYSLCTWEVNPNYTEDALREEYKYKMSSFYRDFMNRPDISGGAAFPNKVRLDRGLPNVFDYDINEVPEEYLQYEHVMAVDPAYRNDSFGVAVGFKIDNTIIIDGVMKFQKENTDAYILPSDIDATISAWSKKLNVNTLIYDVDTVMYLVEKFDKEGKITIKHVAGADAYSIWINLNDNNQQDMPYTLTVTYNEFLEREANSLIKTETKQTAKLKFDHPTYGGKDIADTVANCIWYLANHEVGYIYTPMGHCSTI